MVQGSWALSKWGNFSIAFANDLEYLYGTVHSHVVASTNLLKWLEFSLTLHWTRECLVLAGALGTAPHVYFAAVTIVAHCLKGCKRKEIKCALPALIKT